MANSKSSKKRARQNQNINQRNASLRSALGTAVRKVKRVVASGQKEEAQQVFSLSSRTIDKMNKVGLIHANKAARYKSRLSAQIKAMA